MTYQGHATGNDSRTQNTAHTASSRLDQLSGLVSYLNLYKSEINHTVQLTAPPLHQPADGHHVRLSTLLRRPFPAQADVITAATKALAKQAGLYICGEMGTGKTLIGAAIPYIHRHNARTVILCPGHLVNKWQREIEITIPNAKAEIIETAAHAERVAILTQQPRPDFPQYFIMSKETAKLGYFRQPAANTIGRRTEKGHITRRLHKLGMKEGKREKPNGIKYVVTDPKTGNPVIVKETPIFCPNCGARIAKPARTERDVPRPLDYEDLDKDLHCPACDAVKPRRKQTAEDRKRHETTPPGRNSRHFTALYQADNTKCRKVALADYLKRRGARFDFLIADEVHELKGADTAQGNALGKLGSISRKVLALTGTLIGGYSSHLFYLNYRMNPAAMKRAAFTYGKTDKWVERYGVKEVVTRETKSADGTTRNARSQGSKGGTNTSTSERPGISPALFADQLLNNSIFVHLEDVAAALPPLTETPVLVPMDYELETAYRSLEFKIKSVMAPQIRLGNKRLLSVYLNALLSYPDKPFGNEAIPLDKFNVAVPAELPDTTFYAKERELIDIASRAKANGRKTLVYLNFTGKKDTQPRLRDILEAHGLRTGILRAEVKPKAREAWIEKHAPDLDCLICNPEIVKTGLDLIMFPTIVFYQTGYNVFTLRQAARRSWRLGQTEPVEIYYLTYDRTMQSRAIQLIGRKLSASMAIEGKLSSEGLLALTGEDEDDSIALARALVENEITDGIESVWRTINQQATIKVDIEEDTDKDTDEAKNTDNDNYSTHMDEHAQQTTIIDIDEPEIIAPEHPATIATYSEIMDATAPLKPKTTKTPKTSQPRTVAQLEQLSKTEPISICELTQAIHREKKAEQPTTQDLAAKLTSSRSFILPKAEDLAPQDHVDAEPTDEPITEPRKAEDTTNGAVELSFPSEPATLSASTPQPTSETPIDKIKARMAAPAPTPATQFTVKSNAPAQVLSLIAEKARLEEKRKAAAAKKRPEWKNNQDQISLFG